MDGVHDLGGREGFGPIVDKADDKPFHADWEMRAFGMKQASATANSWTIDWFRHCRELTDPVEQPVLPEPVRHQILIIHGMSQSTEPPSVSPPGSACRRVMS